MVALGVNIDHVATLRQARKTSYPSPVAAALIAESVGADAITLHLREDRRHIQEYDVETLRQQLKIRMNLECAITEEMVTFACRIKPHDVCLVPERREELTTEGGLDVVRYFKQVKPLVLDWLMQEFLFHCLLMPNWIKLKLLLKRVHLRLRSIRDPMPMLKITMISKAN